MNVLYNLGGYGRCKEMLQFQIEAPLSKWIRYTAVVLSDAENES